MTSPTNRVFLMDGEEVDLDELVEANQEGLDPEELTAIAAMRPGDKHGIHAATVPVGRA